MNLDKMKSSFRFLNIRVDFSTGISLWCKALYKSKYQGHLAYNFIWIWDAELFVKILYNTEIRQMIPELTAKMLRLSPISALSLP